MNGPEFKDVFQPFSLEEWSERSVSGAMKYISSLTQLDPNNRLLNGRILQCEVYHFLRELGLVVQVEYPYERQEPGVGSLDKCDLWFQNGVWGTVWVELKIVTYSTDGHKDVLHNNLPTQLPDFLNDLNRLNQYAEADHAKVGILLGLFDFNDEQERERQVGIRPVRQENVAGERIKHYPSFEWRGFDLCPTVWIWAWNGQLEGGFMLEQNTGR